MLCAKFEPSQVTLFFGQNFGVRADGDAEVERVDRFNEVPPPSLA